MAAETATLTEQRKIELVMAQLESLPALSPIVTRILEITSDSSSNSRELISLIEGDPSLTARVLSTLNRSDLGVRGAETATVATAVTLLGYKTIRHVALGVKVMELFGSPDDEGDSPKDFDRLEFWKHCLGVACAARGLADALGGWEPEEAFVCGLLHDIGKAAVEATLPKSAARIARAANETRGDISDCERSFLGMDHAVIGRRLAERWGLPQRVIESIWLHHQDADSLPPSVAAGRHVQIVQLADTLVRERRIGWSGNHRIGASSGMLATSLGLAETALEEITATLVDEIERRAEWIGLAKLDGRELYIKALGQASAELAALNASLADQNQRFAQTARYFDAMGWLSQNLSPRATVREVCGAAAEAVRQALDVPAALCFAGSMRGDYLDIGAAETGQISTEIVDASAVKPPDPREADFAARLALTGTWLSPPGRSFDSMLDKHRGMFDANPIWLLPLVLERRFVGGVLLSAEPERVAAWHAEARQLGALVATLGLALSNARSRTDSLALGEELTEANRRSTAAAAENYHARTLQTIVAMAAGAAHEMNNPLAVISGRAQMLRSRAVTEEDRRSLDVIIEQVKACSSIATELMEFARPAAPATESVAVLGPIEQARRALIDRGAFHPEEVTLEVASDTPIVAFDGPRLTRVFTELLANAAAATTPPSRRIGIKACLDRTDKQVVVLVSDNGQGMPPEVLERAMDPFFSHQPAGRRRGLGLTRVRHWVRQSGGDVRLESRPGEGTIVRLRLPIFNGSSGRNEVAGSGV